MIILKEIKQSKVLVIGESYGKVSSDALPFIDEQSSLALRVGFQTSAPENFVTPDFIEINNPLNVDLDQNIIDSFKDLFNLYEYVVCVGRTPLKAWFNSLSKGRSMETITNSPFLEPLEYPSLKVGVLPHFKSAFSKDSEDPLSDYWDKIKYLFADKPNYNCTETKINDEQEFVQLLHFLETLPSDTIFGLDYETNAVDQFNQNFKVTMYGLAYLVDKHNAKGFWYHPPKNEPLSDFAMQHWKAFLDRNYKRIWAYNVPFEIKTTWDQVGEMYRMQDAMVLMTVQGKRGSLKNVMRSELGASLWESSVHEFMDITEAMFKYTKRSKNRDIIEEMFKNHDLEGLRKLHKNFDKWFDMILEDYEESDILHAIDNYPYPWASVPPNVLGPYCAKDAGFALLLVANYLTDEYKQAYDFYMNHPWLATKFEVNGCPWDDKIAKQVKSELSQQALDRLYNVIINLDTISQKNKMLARDTYFKELPYEIISYTEKQKKERRTLIKDSLDKIEVLKSIFNPNSNTEESRKLFWDAYLTNDITLGTIMNIFIEDMEFNQSLKPLYDILGHDFVKTNSIQAILEKISDPDKFITDKDLSNQCKRSLQKAISEYKDMLGKFSTDLIKNQYQVHKRWLGLKIDDESTWSKNWSLVFDLFLFKKITKTISTNIDGKTGRSLVTEVIGTKWGKPLRGRYWGEKPEDENWDDKETVLNNSFNSLSADTLRWSSSFHTVPQSNPIRSILHPNENGYLMLHSDFSALEVCCVAFMSGATKMIEALLDGKDMHRFVASEAFGKPESEITSDERKAAKGITFGLLYGKSVESMAIDITGGDVEKAQHLFDLYFDAFPEIKTWINERHKEIEKNRNFVKGYFGNKLMIDDSKKGNGALRNAQNAPIQNLGSAIAGTTMYYLSEKLDSIRFGCKPFGFTHDAYDDIVPVDNIIEYIDYLDEYLVQQPRKGLGIPLSIDTEIGANSLNQCSIKILDRQEKYVKIKLKGTVKAIEEIIEQLRYATVYTVENVEFGETESNYFGWEELFTVGKALKYEWGKTIESSSVTLDLIYK